PGFLILDDALEAAREGQLLTLDGDEGRHAAKVARIGVGEQVLLTDGPGRQVPAEVTAARKEALDLRLLADPSAALQRLPRLALVQALATGGRDEQAVESATELGADRIVPWIAGRSVSVWRGDKLAKGRAKWAATVRAAVKQCRRPGLPAVDEPLTSAQLLEALRRRGDGADPARAGVHRPDEPRWHAARGERAGTRGDHRDRRPRGRDLPRGARGTARTRGPPGPARSGSAAHLDRRPGRDRRAQR